MDSQPAALPWGRVDVNTPSSPRSAHSNAIRRAHTIAANLCFGCIRFFFIIIIIIIIVIIIFIFHASGLKPVMVTSAKKTEAESSQCIHSAPLGFKYEMEDEN